jgi:beta-glucosidase
VQCYVAARGGKRVRPPKELRAFQKLALAPGESRGVRLTLPARAFQSWDPDAGGWAAEPGDVEILVGASSRDVRARANLSLEIA